MQLAIEAYQVILASQAERNFGDFRYMFGQGKGYIMETTSIYIINPDTEKPVSMEARPGTNAEYYPDVNR